MFREFLQTPELIDVLGSLRKYFAPLVFTIGALFLAGSMFVLFLPNVISFRFIAYVFFVLVFMGLIGAFKSRHAMNSLIAEMKVGIEPKHAFYFHFFIAPLNFAVISFHIFLVGLLAGWYVPHLLF
ncbi:hypothetical protein HY967_03540 [Candidatus Jorgensenbacteria bacterium]|nr:hypothetical protein [Candidatus Jorgensenbacteria bacterium]